MVSRLPQPNDGQLALTLTRDSNDLLGNTLYPDIAEPSPLTHDQKLLTIVESCNSIDPAMMRTMQQQPPMHHLSVAGFADFTPGNAQMAFSHMMLGFPLISGYEAAARKALDEAERTKPVEYTVALLICPMSCEETDTPFVSVQMCDSFSNYSHVMLHLTRSTGPDYKEHPWLPNEIIRIREHPFLLEAAFPWLMYPFHQRRNTHGPLDNLREAYSI